ncbi:MAG: T9SS type A sorting domain-containing protein [Parafilimonas sp.]
MKHLLFFVFSFLLNATIYSQRVDTVTNDTWQNTAWQHSTRDVFSYNSSCFVTTVLIQNWQQSSSTWADTLLLSYTYNANNSINQILTQIWNSNTSMWDNTFRETFSYNSNNATDSVLTEGWLNNNWKNAFLFTYTYNADGTVNILLSQIWFTSWTNSSRITYTYNADKTVNQDVTQTWDLIFHNWTNASRNTYTYSATKKILTDLNEIWKSNQWKNNELTTNTYDGNDYLINTLSQGWNSTTSSWENDYQTNYTNNSNGTVAVAIFQNWDKGTSTWINDTRSTYSYNSCALPLTLASFTATLKDKVVELNWVTLTESNTKNFVVQRSSDGINFENIGTVNAVGNSTQKTSYQFPDASAFNAGAAKFYYRLQMVDKDGSFTYSKIATAEFINRVIVKISPNPVKDILKIEGLNSSTSTTLMITDISGRVVAQINITAETYSWNIQRLPSGIYYLMVTENNKQAAAIKFIKQ